MLKSKLWTSLFVGTSLLALSTAHGAPPEEIPDHFIVTLKPGFGPADVALTHGAAVKHEFSAALNGFAGKIPPARLRALRADKRVSAIEPDLVVNLAARKRRPILEPAPIEPTPIVAPAPIVNDPSPTGVDRVDAEVNSQRDCSTIGIAIIDTGLAYGHPDLNIAGGVSYVTGVSSANDDNGHGTHVGGIAAAVNNGSGIRGVAPNARLFAVKVLDASGSGSLSAILSGIDWVTRNASAKGIKVANMSLGFEGSSSSLNTAIHNSIAAGVVYIVAAGNSARDATTFSPANHAEVICVSAIADSDGKCGGLGSWTGYGYDDTFASFSNYGAVVDIAAPGVNIYSTYVNGQYATMSGTSMAAPHVAGAAALYLSKYPTTTPATVRSILIQRATPQLMAPTVDGTRTRGGFTGDFDGSSEPLLDAANL